MDAVVALLTDDVRLAMPPLPLEYRGRGPVALFLNIASVHGERQFRLVQTRANGQPAFGLYARDTNQGSFRAVGLLVVTLAGEKIAAITRFEMGVLPKFGLRRSLRD